MTNHTQEINPSEDDRESIMEFLDSALRDTNDKIKEIETLLKKSKQKMTLQETKELELEQAHYTRNIKLIEDALAKTERTSGHTLKKAFNKKLFIAVNQVEGDKKCEHWVNILDRNGLCHALKARRLSEHARNQLPLASVH